MFLMPLINVSKLKRNVKKMLLPAALMSANELSVLPNHICAICHENNNTSAAPGTTTSTVIHNPYITNCSHVYCYYCIKTKMMIDDEWCCLRCNKRVEAIARYIEIAEDKALEIKDEDQELADPETREIEQPLDSTSSEKA
ncbi:hypothetical protein BC939DRAFT_61986 [Gamsiella multidivaricata]|uniref:uncharacterized protein n=1 Tax=Gamsiella multidivaricata TaxID=101098 RepID=UPI00221E615A|nr:uncharacterized protein BC939DRAFT_61986 [Gamsiella multidivaricata]KAI7828634.1 hypothetical protein BC939DRAFT_61986 [Gamsiella multidivaricata]